MTAAAVEPARAGASSPRCRWLRALRGTSRCRSDASPTACAGPALAFTAPLRSEGTQWTLQIWTPAEFAAATVGTAGRSRLWLDGRCIDERPLAWPGAALQAPLHMKLMTGADSAAMATYAWVALLPGELSDRQLALRARLARR